MKIKVISLLTASALLATSSPAIAQDRSQEEIYVPYSVSTLELHSTSKAEAVINEALTQAMPYIESPQKFEEVFTKHLELRGYSADTPLPVENTSSSMTPSVVPAVIIAARFALCVSSFYTVLATIPKEWSYHQKAMGVGAAIAGCIGGAGAGNVVGRWIINNPRVAAGVFNAVGLGHLSGDASRG